MVRNSAPEKFSICVEPKGETRMIMQVIENSRERKQGQSEKEWISSACRIEDMPANERCYGATVSASLGVHSCPRPTVRRHRADER